MVVAQYVIVVESGSDVTPDLCERYGIVRAPMHVTIGDEVLDDGSISPLEIYSRCNEMGVLPKTSGCSPADFADVFDRIHAEQPGAQIIHLAYSAATTCSYQSALIAAEGRDYVHSIDTKFVSVGQSWIAQETAKFIEANPDATVEEVLTFAERASERVLLGFVPTDLAFLKAGGRLSNMAFLGAHLLKIKPCIEVTGGTFVATKKFRGSMLKVSKAFLDHMVSLGDIDYSWVGLAYSVGLSDELRDDMAAYAGELGFEDVTWTQVGGVISSHCGPTAFGAILLKQA
ncbi:MAG: DegV family protein [Collinsella phocaeensis]